MNNILIIGGNRGIGLELCRQLSARGDDITATCRQTSTELRELGVDILENIDVSIAEDVEKMKQALSGQSFDMVIHNAGILTSESLENMDFQQIEKQFQVNTMGPLRTVHALLENGNIGSGSKIGLLSSRMGSMGDNSSGGRYGYRISKAGINALGVSLAHDLGKREIAVAILHPGMVATEMTGKNGINPAEAADNLIHRLDELTMETSGSFWHAEGYVLPW